METPEIRANSGRFVRGASGNPGGRPREWVAFREAMRELSPRAVELVAEALESDDPKHVRWACDTILKYAYGHAPQRDDSPAPGLQVTIVKSAEALQAAERARLAAREGDGGD